ncbi:MAG: enoyl-CoA hydratase/isomerase family protein [Planctomycetota bacterium]|nr:enoyl-CoA hydratase/isomerase family protein [Planctomycetota bacterium]
MIRLKKTAPSGTMIIDAPATRNAMSREMIQQLIDAISDFHQDKSVRAVILTSTGSTFCSGVDLKQWQSQSQERDAIAQWHDVASALHELIESMLRLPKPILAAVDGPALGFGLALVLACDLVVASPGSAFEIPSTRLGLVSGLTLPLLAFRFGASAAARMAIGGQRIDATEAHQMGLAHRLVPSDQIWAACHAWVGSIAESSPESIQLSKRLLNEMVGESLLMNLSSGAAVLATACSTESAVEGLTAFVEKRPPKFPGS